MKTDTTEYLEAQEQTQTSRDPKFRIEKAPDKDTGKILQARYDVCTDPELCDGARNFFTYLLDAALDAERWFKRRGQVCISNLHLREQLSRSARAIYGWTFDLVRGRYIWVTKLPRPNMQPQNIFHITALQPEPKDSAQLPGEGFWGNGYRQPSRPMPAGARGGPYCKKRHYLFDRFGKPLIPQSADYQPEPRTFCGSLPHFLRGAPAKNDTCPPQLLRESAEDFAGGTRKKGHLPPAKIAGETVQKPSVLRESPDVSQRPLEPFNNVQRMNAFKKGGENGFLQHVAVVMARWNKDWALEEMEGSGAWWRMKYRQDPNKIARVLADVETMIKEGKSFDKNPGACAVDLWGRFA